MDYNSLIYSAKIKKNEAMPQANRHTPTDCKRVYMVINFRAREINRDARKLTRTPMLIKNNNNKKNLINYKK